MYTISKNDRGELRFTLASSSSKTEIDDRPSTVKLPICNVCSTRTPYHSWVHLNNDILEAIYQRFIDDMIDVTYSCDIPVKLYIDYNLLKELLYKKIYKASYNSYRKTNHIY